MTRQELLKKLCSSVELSRKDCGAVVTALFDEIVHTLEDGGSYTHTGFGTFETTVCSERTVRNPFTKLQTRYPKKRKVKFVPSKAFKELLNET